MFENKLINETASKERHFGDWYFIFIEQDNGELYIGIRRVTSLNRNNKELRKVCEPNFLIRRLNKLKRRVLKRGIKTSYKLYDKISRLKKRISKIGYLLVKHRDYGNSELRTELEAEGSYCICKNTCFKYETRACMFEYAALDMPLKGEANAGMYQPPASPDKLKPIQTKSKADFIKALAEWRKIEKADYENREWAKNPKNKIWLDEFMATYREVFAEYLASRSKT